ncbi:hypothetical protein SMNI109538_14140 [Smaragdicoccus niigatensis]
MHAVSARERAECLRDAAADRLHSHPPQGGDAGTRPPRGEAILDGFANRGIEMWVELGERAAPVHDLQECAKDAFGENARRYLELIDHPIGEWVPGSSVMR